MKRLPDNWTLQALSIVCAVIPFAFALVRALRTGDDFRYLLVALASLLGAAVVVAVGNGDPTKPLTVFPLAAGVFIIAMVCALLAAFLLRTRVGLGMFVVGSAFAFCHTASYLCHSLARRERI